MLPPDGNPNFQPQPATSRPAPGHQAGPGNDTPTFTLAPPKIELPKGGGAIRGIGEKFTANPVTGTGTISVPVATSPGRSGFGPQLALTYDSGAGNGPCGIGWSIPQPQITRKTDKIRPRYLDADNPLVDLAPTDLDTFILSDHEDLVPVLDDTGRRFETTTAVPGYTVHRYRPRIDALFARIERWTRHTDGDTHWRSLSTDNILTIYGLTPNSRLADPEHPSHVFKWLISETRDDNGNGIIYEYKPEDGEGVDLDAPHQLNRGTRNNKRRTANRYLKRIRYGNRRTLLDETGHRPQTLSTAQLDAADWMFDIVFNYGEHDHHAPSSDEVRPWPLRPDPFSNYSGGFDIRTNRRCQSIFMIHHFPGEPGVGADCVVKSTDLEYGPPPTDPAIPPYSFLRAVTHTGYKRRGDSYLTRSMPPVEFEYTQPALDTTVHELDRDTGRDIPLGLADTRHRWIDLHGEGIPGILTEHGNAWYYKRNLSPTTSDSTVKFAAAEPVRLTPNTTLTSNTAQFMDLAGDGSTDVVVLDGPNPGFYEHDDADGWRQFQVFTRPLNRRINDPNARLLDLTGDGLPDLIVSEDNCYTWYPSLGETGYGPSQYVAKALDEEHGPRLIFADATESFHLADMTGDGHTDLVRISNGNTSYWPNLGYGRFGRKVTMDNSPRLVDHTRFDPKMVLLADVDGSGTTDLIYLAANGPRVYFNHSGNSWSTTPVPIEQFPITDQATAVDTADLRANGTTCLTWSTKLPSTNGAAIKFVDLMADQKPHLLTKIVNNLGAETTITYAPSTKFYLAHKNTGRPWITKLPFPVHVVERVQTDDKITKNRFVSSYVYRDGYFDPADLEFRGFGMFEQVDTEFLATATNSAEAASNDDPVHNVPPVLTKTWFHTGANDIATSRQVAAEYYRESGGVTRDQADAMLLPDTILPATLLRTDGSRERVTLTTAEAREASRALKGSMLRQEIYALDSQGADGTSERPYQVTEANVTVELLQRQAGNRHAVFTTHTREQLTFVYERALFEDENGAARADPRVAHQVTLEVDGFGNPRRTVSIAYPRRHLIPTPRADHAQRLDDSTLDTLTTIQNRTLLATLTDNVYTNPILGDASNHCSDSYRGPHPAQTTTYELVHLTATKLDPNITNLIDFGTLREQVDTACNGNHDLDPTDLDNSTADRPNTYRRLLTRTRTLYNKDNLTGALPFGQLEPRAFPYEQYALAFTPAVLATYRRTHNGSVENLIPDTDILGKEGGYLSGDLAKTQNLFPTNDPRGLWWTRSGRTGYSPNESEDLAFAIDHFYLPHRHTDPFGNTTTVSYDDHKLLATETRDPLDNRITAGTRHANGAIDDDGLDYRVLAPKLIADPNRNRAAVAYDTLGMVVGTAVMGKPERAEGDSLEGFAPVTDLEADLTTAHIRKPLDDPWSILADATTRITYDLHAYRDTANQPQPQPVVAHTLARETHAADLAPGQQTKIQHTFSYTDGFGRSLQTKTQAEPGPVPTRNPNGDIIVDAEHQPVMTDHDVAPRWVGTGWTIYNNKGQPVRRYEPFFTDTHRYEPDQRIGVSPTIFYDPLGRPIVTLHPDHTYDKTTFDPWQQTVHDVNDTVTTDPRTDPDTETYVADYFAALETANPGHPWLTWYAQRINDDTHPLEKQAAQKAESHDDTPTTTHFDTLGRPVVTVTYNRISDPAHRHRQDGLDSLIPSRVRLDIQGNTITVHDVSNNAPANTVEERIVARYRYDLLARRIRDESMDAGTRWTLSDVADNPIHNWDSRGHTFTTAYDALRRPTTQTVHGRNLDGPAASDPRTLTETPLVVGMTIYGESVDRTDELNLRTRAFRLYDTAGVTTSARFDANDQPAAAYDFKGNLLHSTIRLLVNYNDLPSWAAAAAPPLEDEYVTTATRYDAMNRAVQSIAPHSSHDRSKLNITQPVYNEANLLEQLHVWLERDAESTTLLDPTAEPPSQTLGVHNVTYDAKGQRLHITYKNGVTTRYRYDPNTFRLRQLDTTRGSKFTDVRDNDNPAPASRTIAAPKAPSAGPRRGLQNLCYTYDPAGNITHIHDAAQQRTFFKNQLVEPDNDYTYDALYRLVTATGREHVGQILASTRKPPTRPGPLNEFHIGQQHPGDFRNMATYREDYSYDLAGNLTNMHHHGTSPKIAGWTLQYDYRERSPIEDGTDGPAIRTNNRLSSTTLNPDDGGRAVAYTYDTHGNITRMPHLGNGDAIANMHWDYADHLRRTDHGGGGRTHHIYAGGQRTRKIAEKSPGLTEERIYYDGYEIHRIHATRDGADLITLERETLHILDNKRRIALAETRTIKIERADPAPRQLIRYQIGNHIESVGLELDPEAQIISYEEYTPFGSTTYQATRKHLETPPRYRYTGKERDDESGLDYHSHRFYAPWIGRWISADPAGIAGGANLYLYANNSPVRFHDSDGLAPNQNQPDFKVGAYRDVGGDHTHQVADRTPGPNTRSQASEIRGSLATSTKHPDYRDKLGQRVENKINRAQWGADIHDPIPQAGSWETQVTATGETTVGTVNAARPSPWAADTKAYHKSLTATKGANPDASLANVTKSAEHLEDAGATVARVPNPPRNAPKDLKKGVPVSRQAPASKVFEPANAGNNPYRPPVAATKPTGAAPKASGGSLKAVGGTLLAAGGGALAAKGFYDAVSTGDASGAVVEGTSFASAGLIVGGAVAGSAALGTAGTVLAIPVAAYGLGKGAVDAGSPEFAAAAGAAWDGPNSTGPTITGGIVAGTTAIVTAPYFVAKGAFNSARDAGNWLGDATYRWLN